MDLEIDGQPRTLIPLKVFRTQFSLPDHFGCTYFEKKDWAVGSLHTGAEALFTVKRNVLQAVLSPLTLLELLQQPEHVAAAFRANLEAVNSQIGLNQEQLDFAVDGLHNLLAMVTYELARLHHLSRDQAIQTPAQFDFGAIYQSWLNQSVSIFGKTYRYHHGDRCFDIQVISYLYGRVGLRIETAGDVYYVADATLACPAATFMGDLAEAIAQAFWVAVNASASL